MIKSNSITPQDRYTINNIIDEVIARAFAEDFGLYDNCETDEEIEAADLKQRELVRCLVEELIKSYQLDK